MAAKNKMSREDYFNEIRGIRNTGSSSLHKNDKESGFEQAYNEAIQTLRDIQSLVPGVLLTGPITATVISNGNNRSDVDNICKAALDSAQGIVFENDKQVWKLYAERRV